MERDLRSVAKGLESDDFQLLNLIHARTPATDKLVKNSVLDLAPNIAQRESRANEKSQYNGPLGG
jgi:hypothetical protein